MNRLRMSLAPRFGGLASVVSANRRAGHRWFDDDTMRALSSRVESRLHGGRFFVSSEQEAGSPRRFTLRRVLADGTIGNASGFQAFDTLADALERAREMAAES